MSLGRDRHQRLRAVFDEAVLQRSSARAIYLDEACGSHPTLKPDVVRLLARHRDAGSFLERPSDAVLPLLREEEPFAGTDRFEVVRRLGAGGMGVVYEVHDQVRDETVALKTLVETSAADLYRLKREFRCLAGIAHPNLVCLYELFVEAADCFFTMELVKGVSFVEYARSSEQSLGSLPDLVRQLVDGVSSLHRCHRLHRDLKPSNILVTARGRVVILDFGLIAEVGTHDGRAVHYVPGGTPAYVSPEEIDGADPSEASDWYSVGATLYEALTGVVPFSGSARDVLNRKRAQDPPAPSTLVPSVPHAWSNACMGLLQRDPCRRLSGRDALAMIVGGETSLVPSARTSTGDGSFVGRDHELRRLHEAVERIANRVPANRCIHGASGIGKSALVRRFLRQLAAERDDVVVLSGRCYENESVPYKALDGVVDDLSRHLRTLLDEEVECVLPAHAASLTRAFPVLRQVRAICAASDPDESDDINASSSRRQAFDALRELLARLADRCLLVVAIDDFHWADPDSVVLLEALLQEPHPPVMLTLLSFRGEETEAKPFLRALLARSDDDAWAAIAIDALADEEAARLMHELIPAEALLSADDRCSLTREAGGSPFLIEQLARYVGVAAGTRSHSPTLAGMLHARLAMLSGDARRFLETLAVCGRPMPPALICDASGVVSERQSLITILRASHFIRSSGSPDRVEAYHDRIRELLATEIEAGYRQRIHARLVQALVARRSDDCESLFEHCRGAGDYESAAVHAGLAADKAAAVLAFDRAAVFYGEALAIAPASPKAAAWRTARANALACAGRPADAAEAYLLAAGVADAAERRELHRRAAQQFLIGGHIDRGRELIRGVLAGVGVRAARSLCGAVVSLLWRRAQLRLRGLRFLTRPASDIERITLARVDACWASATGLAMVDMIATSAYSARHLLMALDAGEPSRIARGLALEAAGRSATPRSRPWSRHLVEQAKTLAHSSGNLPAIATAALADATIAIASGEWKQALAAADAAAPILRDRCVGVGWELSIGQSLGVLALLYLGELAEASRRVFPLLADARSRGNLYLTTELCTRSNLVWLAADKPDEGEQQARECMTRWSHTGFQRQHYSLLLARVQAALYRGRPEDAWRLVVAQEPRLRRSFLTSVQLIRIETHFMRGRCALMMATSTTMPGRWLSIARAAARRIAREHMPWSDPLALLLNAGVSNVERNRTLAHRLLEDAALGFDRVDMKLHAAAARRRLGEQQANTWMLAQQIANPTAMTRVLAPGFADE